MNTPFFRLILVIIAIIALTILPLPTFLGLFRPAWVLMLALFLQLLAPQLFSVLLVVLLGLSLDVLLATVMGEHVLALAFTAWIASSKARRFHLFTLGQQSALVGVSVIIYQLTLASIEAMLGNHLSYWSLVFAPLTSAFIWPWMRFIVGDALRLGLKA